jgi:PTS system nitrogen regulatory IIA component
MDLRVRDVAALLGESEETIIRLAKRGELPCHRVQDQYFFNRVELQEWAAQHNRPVAPELFASDGQSAELPSLAAAVERGGIHYNVTGDTREQVLAAVTELPGIPVDVNRALLLQLLVGREALASTALGNGIAIPHPRTPLVVRSHEASVLLCFLKTPVDFGALDQKPVRVLFTLLSPSVRVHLRLLAKIAFALHDDLLVRRLAEPAAQDVLLARLRELDLAHNANTSAASPTNTKRQSSPK